MASLAHQTDLAAWIDQSLDYLTMYWTAIPEIAAGWDEREEHDRLDFVVEWPLREDRLRQLRCWEEEGHLSPPQLTRLEEIERLIQRHRPTLDRLLAE
jgi:hypothetical protein